MHDRAYKEVGGIVYDSDTAEVLHYVDVFTNRKILAVTPDGHYFEAIYGGMLCGWVVFPQSKLWAVELALRYKASDDVLEGLGVDILRTVESDEPYNLVSADVLWGKKIPFDLGYQLLARNYDGRFFLFRNIDIFGVRIKWVKPKTQRQALRWAIWNVPRDVPESFQMLGLSQIDDG